MKHQALARVFSVVLAILCLLMLLNGVTGFGKMEKAQQERASFENKLAQRIENYRTLDDQLAHSISYDEAYEQFKALSEQHEKDAAQHRTDTALYTAEKGGNTMGANLLWEALPQVEGAKQEFETAKQQFESVQNAYDKVKSDAEAIAAQARNDAAESGMDASQLQQLAQNFSALLNAEPSLPEDFQMPEDPGEPPEEPAEPQLTAPTAPKFERPIAPEEPAADADEESRAAYEQASKAWEDYDAQQAEYDAAMAAYQREKADFESYPERKKAYDEALAQQRSYEEQHAAWEEQVSEAAARIPLESYMEKLQVLGDDLQELAEKAGPLLSTFSELSAQMGQADMPGVDMSALQTLAKYANADLSSMTEEQILAASQEIAGALSSLSGAFSSVSGGAESIDAAMAGAAAKLDAAEQALKKAEAEVKGQLANIWYNLDQLEERADKLAEEKKKLDLEALDLDKQLLETDQLRSLRNRHISARQLLVNIPEIKKDFAESGDLIQSAERFLENYRSETQRLYRGRRLLNLLAVIGGIAGILGIPSAYERLRGRFWLLAPVLVCLACAAGADVINMRLGLGQMYTALFTALFAAIQLLIILPKKKTFPTGE